MGEHLHPEHLRRQPSIEVAEILTGTATGPLYRYNDMFGLRAIAHKYFGEGNIQPYLGFGIGLVWSYAFQQIADLDHRAGLVLLKG